jgi:hypothetical protein
MRAVGSSYYYLRPLLPVPTCPSWCVRADVPRERAAQFDMKPKDAVLDAIAQLKAQGVDVRLPCMHGTPRGRRPVLPRRRSLPTLFFSFLLFSFGSR